MENKEATEDLICANILKTIRERIRKEKLDNTGKNLFLENIDVINEEFDTLTKNLIREHSVSKLFIDEECYPEKDFFYHVDAKKIDDQLLILNKHFPKLETISKVYHFDKNSTEGKPNIFIIPDWEKVSTSYGSACEIILNILISIHGSNFSTSKVNEFFTWDIKPTLELTRGIYKLKEIQKNSDYLIFNCNLGLKHAGKSARRALATFKDNEFPLGVFEVGVILITHPELLKGTFSTYIGTPGSLVERRNGSGNKEVVYFGVNINQIYLTLNGESFRGGCYTTASHTT